MGAIVSCTAVLGIDQDYERGGGGDGSGGSTTAAGGGTSSAGGMTSSGGGTASGGGTTTSGGGGGSLPVGSPCMGADACAGGHCVDGICCEAVCNKECEACASSKSGGTDGSCVAIPAYDDPDSECGQDQACDGSRGCKRIDGVSCNSSGQCISGNCNNAACEP